MQSNLDRSGFDITLANMFSNSAYSQTYLFYAHMVGMCSVKLTTEVQVAGVCFEHDHYVLAINPEQFNPKPLHERLAIIKHEMLHILNNHIARREDRDQDKWNIATDCAINQFITPGHMTDEWITTANFPGKPGALIPKNLSAEHYYELVEIPPQDDNQSQSGGSGSSPIDDHDFWNQSVGHPDLQQDLTHAMIGRAINQTQRSRGNLPSNISDLLALFTRKSEVNWRQVLKGIVGNKKVNSRRTIMRSDRRMPGREDLRGKTKDRLFDLIIIGDESGSVSSSELSEAISEVQNICTLTKSSVKYIPVDTVAHTPVDLTSSQRTFTRTACGGTNLHPALDKAKEHRLPYNALVVITDGGLCESDVAVFAKQSVPIIWLITTGGYVMDSMNSGNMKAFKLTPQS